MPARVGRRAHRRATQRFGRGLDRPARQLVDVEADQGEIGRVDASLSSSTLLILRCDRRIRASNQWQVFARITPELSCKGIT